MRLSYVSAEKSRSNDQLAADLTHDKFETISYRGLLLVDESSSSQEKSGPKRIFSYFQCALRAAEADCDFLGLSPKDITPSKSAALAVRMGIDRDIQAPDLETKMPFCRKKRRTTASACRTT